MPNTILIQVCTNTDRFYSLDGSHLTEAVKQPRETRMSWLYDRMESTWVHDTNMVDVVIVPDEEDGWDDFEDFVGEYQPSEDCDR